MLHHFPNRPSPLTALSLLLAGLCACNDDARIASACDGGDCGLATAANSEALRCQVGSSQLEIAAKGYPLTRPLCLPRAFGADEDGKIACEVTLALDGADCDVAEHLLPTDEPGKCLLPQLAARRGAPTEAGEGWFYGAPNDVCVGTEAAANLSWTANAMPADLDLRLHLLCAHADVAVGEHITAATVPDQRVPVDPGQCTLPEVVQSQDLGQTCSTIAPPGGFDDREALLETGNPDCDTGLCLAFELNGITDPDCVDRDCAPSDGAGCPSRLTCADPEDVAARMQCTCRCDAPDDQDVCTCADDQTCLPLIFSGPLEGSYCVNSDVILPGRR